MPQAPRPSTAGKSGRRPDRRSRSGAGQPSRAFDARTVARQQHHARLRRNRKGGLTIYASDESERFVYYYAHLSAYRHGIIKGTRLARGQVIGFVGTTGNADRRAPHLHFQVMARRRGGRWWKGEPIDPRPFFASTGRARYPLQTAAARHAVGRPP